MKNSNRILRILAVTYLVAFALSFALPFTSHADKAATVQTELTVAAMGAIALPFALTAGIRGTNKKSHWRKNVPLAMLITPITPDASHINKGDRSGIIRPAPGVLPSVFGGDRTALNAGGVVQSQVSQVFANSNSEGILSYKYSITSSYAGGVIPLLPQFSSDTLPTGVTLASGSSNFSTFAALVNYATKWPLIMGDLVVYCSDTTDFDNPVVFTYTFPDGSNKSNRKSWNVLAKDFDQYDQTGRVLENTGWVTGGPMRYEVICNVPASSSYIKFDWQILGLADVYNFRPFFG